jgi:hypothetical protein
MSEAIVKAGALAVAPSEALTQLKEVEAVFREVMKPGEHYGIIPGTSRKDKDGKELSKPTLLQPGAQLLANIYQYTDRDIIFEDKVQQWDVPVTEATFPLFAFTVKIPFFDRAGIQVGSGIGECNSYETKYRYRESSRRCPACGKEAIIKGKEEYGGGWICFGKKGGCGTKYKTDDPAIAEQKVGRVHNDAIYDQVNTLIKIAKKRAYVNGVIAATRTSGMFTQDMEDFATLQEVDATVVSSTPLTKEKDLTVVPDGIHRGKKLSELTERQAQACITAFEKAGMHADWCAIAKKATADAFGGAFDQRPVEERAADATAMTAAEQQRILAKELVKEALDAIRIVAPTIGKKPVKKADEELALAMRKEVWPDVKKWTDLEKLDADTLRVGLLKLVSVCSRVAKERKGIPV